MLRLLFTRISENFSSQIEIFDPSGARVAASSDVTQKVNAAGNYLVVVSPSTSLTETGAYSIAFQRPNRPCSPVSLTCGQATLRQVSLPGQLDTFTFNAVGGDQVSLRLASRTGAYSPFGEMYDPNGTLLTTSSNGLLRRTPSADGVYTVLVRDRNALNLGSYRVSLQDDTNACPVTDTEAPVITLISPTGGEVLPGGTTFRIQWQSDDNVGVAVTRYCPFHRRRQDLRHLDRQHRRQFPVLRLDHPRRHRAQPLCRTPRHCHRCRGQCPIRLQRPAHRNRFRLHAE